MISPILGILDDCDAAQAKMLVVMYGTPQHLRVDYIHRKQRPLGQLGRRPGSLMTPPPLFTPMFLFGVEATFRANGELKVSQVGESRATYPDSKPRRWQGYSIEWIPLRYSLVRHVLLAVEDAGKA